MAEDECVICFTAFDGSAHFPLVKFSCNLIISFRLPHVVITYVRNAVEMSREQLNQMYLTARCVEPRFPLTQTNGIWSRRCWKRQCSKRTRTEKTYRHKTSWSVQTVTQKSRKIFQCFLTIYRFRFNDFAICLQCSPKVQDYLEKDELAACFKVTWYIQLTYLFREPCAVTATKNIIKCTWRRIIKYQLISPCTYWRLVTRIFWHWRYSAWSRDSPQRIIGMNPP